MKVFIALSILLACASMSSAFAIPPTTASVEPYVRLENFRRISISPDGKYLALSVPIGDHTSLVILDAATLKPVSLLGGKMHVDHFWWVNPDRILYSISEKDGSLDTPVPTGEIFAANPDGKAQSLLFGYRAKSVDTGTLFTSDRQDDATAEVVDDLPGDPNHVLITVTPWTFVAGKETYSTLEKIDVRDGHRYRSGALPLRGADVLTDHRGQARFAFGPGSDNLNRMYYRDGDSGDWILVNDASASHRTMIPMGFSADDSVAYVEASEPTGPDSLQRFDVAKHTMTPLLLDKSTDPSRLLYADGSRRDPIGVIYEDDKPRVTYFDPESLAARSHRSLMAGFDGQFVEPIASTADGETELVEAYSDHDAGDVYRFDKAAKTATLLIRRRDWFDPALMAERRPFEFKARDGMEIHGYLTIPHGSDGKAMPLVVYPHGGPFGISDGWMFDGDAQLLAAHGYAVLQVNYRGSGNRGNAFETAGYKQWGKAMQDDLTDATRWAIASGAADKNRICIYGASYGGYAALMGVAREPALYRCAAGYVGVYDLDLMYHAGDIHKNERLTNGLKQMLGTENLAGISPVNLADRIKVPVFLAAGGEDQRAPEKHTTEMESALKKAGVPVKKLVYPHEGHGFYDPAHVAEFDRQLLEFLDQNIGSEAKVTPAG